MKTLIENRVTLKILTHKPAQLLLRLRKIQKINQFLIMINFKKHIIFDERKYINNKS